MPNIDPDIDREIELTIPERRKAEIRDVLKHVPPLVQRDAFERFKKELIANREI